MNNEYKHNEVRSPIPILHLASLTGSSATT
jgi:hypothetical protein